MSTPDATPDATPDRIPDPYLARRRRKVRRSRAATWAVLAVFGVGLFYMVLDMFAAPVTYEHAYFATLPYPDPHPREAELLKFVRRDGRVIVTTDWLPLTHTPAADPSAPADAVYIRFEADFDAPKRTRPAKIARLHVAATGNAVLPLHGVPSPDMFFRNSSRFYLSFNADMRHEANTTHKPPPPLHSPMLYHIDPDAILDLLDQPPGQPTKVILGNHTAELTELHLTPLRALFATLKPGYQPPPPN